jgi:hypothetical protein
MDEREGLDFIIERSPGNNSSLHLICALLLRLGRMKSWKGGAAGLVAM